MAKLERPTVLLIVLALTLTLAGCVPCFAASDGQLSIDMTKPLDMKHDTIRHPKLIWGYNDLDENGTPDTLVTEWNGKVIAFVSDDGKLPWGADDEGRDWNAYFNVTSYF